MNHKETPFSVGDITQYIKSILERDRQLSDFWVQGELSNFKMAASGHWYFTLKDRNAQLPCVMFRTDVERLRDVHFQQGDQLEARGRLTVYAPGGRYQLQAHYMRKAGLGGLYQQYLERKKRLSAQGYFDEQYKQPLPAFPARIGLITSARGDALKDVLRTLSERYCAVELVLIPCLVQGQWAGGELAHAVATAQEIEGLDVILLVRGGGSFEDLFCFSDDALVEAIFDSSIPVVTGIGHETDYSLADFAADYRAPTPTAAAAAAVPDQRQLRRQILDYQSVVTQRFQRKWNVHQQTIDQHADLLYRSMSIRLDRARRELSHQQDLLRLHPLRQKIDQLQDKITVAHQQRLREKRRHMDVMAEQTSIAMRRSMARTQRDMTRIMEYRLIKERHKIDRLQDQLQMLDVQQVLKRGFAFVTDQQGKLVRDVDAVETGAPLNTLLQNGTLFTKITGKKKNNS